MASRDGAALQGMYDFWSNRRVSGAGILGGHQASTIERIRQEKVVLAIQDTSELDYSEHRKGTKGIGPISDADARGLKLHTVLGVSDAGVPLGILHQQLWSREVQRGVRVGRRERMLEEKESVRWVEGLAIAQELVPSEVQVITIADREADMYELFAQPRRLGSELLIRAAQNRNTKRESWSEEVEPLFRVIEGSSVAGEMELKLQRTPRRRAREAKLTIRYGRVWLQAPAHLKAGGAIEMWAVLAEEEHPPGKERGVRWLLLSTMAIESLEAAKECLRRYSSRWGIERYFYVLKVGCRVEQLQLKVGERLERAIATYSIVAWRLMWVMYLARREPERTVEGILEPEEWQALYLLIYRSKGWPEQAPTLGEAVGWMGKLGGFLGRVGDGEAGVQTIWRGWMRVAEVVAIWELI
jgi:hypothetical protein